MGNNDAEVTEIAGGYSAGERVLGGVCLFAGLVLALVAADVMAGGRIMRALTRHPVPLAEQITKAAAGGCTGC